jgi:hypothetical protein
VSVEEPGGDAHDPHFAALSRNVAQPWGRQADKDDQLLLPLPDADHWKRVRYWGFDHFTGFRYGDEHHVMAVAFLIDDKEDTHPNSLLCLKRFESWARPQIKGYDIKLGEIGERESKWRRMPLYIHYLDGSVVWGFSERQFSAAWAAYPAYPQTCLVYAMAVPWDEFGATARNVRDRWVQEAFERVAPLTKEKPFRHPEPH